MYEPVLGPSHKWKSWSSVVWQQVSRALSIMAHTADISGKQTNIGNDMIAVLFERVDKHHVSVAQKERVGNRYKALGRCSTETWVHESMSPCVHGGN